MTSTGETIRAVDLTVCIHEATLLKTINLELPTGALTVILGPNGAGKTTLIRALGGLDKPTAGQVLWSEEDIDKLSPIERARRVAHIGHEARPPFAWTALELVLMGRAPHLGLRSLERDEDRARARAALEAVDLLEFETRRVDSLSAGETQRLMWARALCQHTATLMLDEPVSHQDPRHALKLMELLRELADKGSTVVAVLHDVSLALRYANHAVLLTEGSVRESGPISTLTPALLSEVYGTPCRREGAHVLFDPPESQASTP